MWTSVGETDEENSKKPAPSRAREDLAPNPFRRPGDALRRWHERLDLLRRGEEEEEEGPPPPPPPPEGETAQKKDENQQDDELGSGEGKFEFAHNEEESTTQVLGGVSEENQSSMPTDNADDDGDANKDQNGADGEQEEPQDMDIQPLEEEKKDHLLEEKVESEQEAKQESAKEGRQTRTKKGSTQNTTGDETTASANNENEQQKEEEEGEEKMEEDGEANNFGFGAQIVTKDCMDVDEEDFKPLGERLKDLLLDPPLDEGSMPATEEERARARWAALRSATAPLAQRLSEQLRLVLEPLVATKLQGDYRTGKRINMKRVISYIASGFRKDRIWMRRTKPAQRNYQVLLAVDDSESMADLGAGPLTLAALATVAAGLAQLEVGELGVARFGRETEVVHPLGAPWTEESGARALGRFTFAEPRTHTAATLARLAAILDEARGGVGSSGGGAQGLATQLVFMISDGRFDRDNKAKLRKVVRDMSENNQLLVLIIIDKDGDSSILNTQEAVYSGGKLQISRYLDNYPFSYYIILQDIDSLPEILTDALRQWFELIQQNNSGGSS